MYNKIMFFVIVTLCLSGCARNFNSNNYTPNSVGSLGTTIEGKIINVRVVNIEGDDGKVAGSLLGAVLGGVAGNAVGGGRGRNITTVVGALAGGAAGSAVGENMSQQNGMEYTMQANDGTLYTVVQGMDAQFSIGQKVMLITYEGYKARNRIIAA